MSTIHPKLVRSAFTIVELLIVIVVIGILSTIVIVTYNGIQTKAKNTLLHSDIESISKQLAMTKAETSSFPDSTQDIKKNETTRLQYTTDGDTYCLTTSAKGASTLHTDQSSGILNGPCPGHYDQVTDLYSDAATTVEQDGVKYKMFKFSSSTSFQIDKTTTVDYLIVGGGGGGGGADNSIRSSGGGGAGGLITGTVTLSAGSYPVVVGTGGDGGVATQSGKNGGNSLFNGLTAFGGGGGGFGENGSGHDGQGGGSGGGAGSAIGNGGSGTSGQGNAGGSSPGEGLQRGGSGGGGAGGNGSNGQSNSSGRGGSGLEIWGTLYAKGGDGGGSGNNASVIGSGGDGTKGRDATGGNGSNGIIIIRYAIN